MYLAAKSWRDKTRCQESRPAQLEAHRDRQAHGVGGRHGEEERGQELKHGDPAVEVDDVHVVVPESLLLVHRAEAHENARATQI